METNPYKLNTGMRCIKFFLLVINLMFLLTAILLVLVGTTIQAIYGDFRQFIDDHFLSPPALLIASGCFMVIVSLFGCFGAIKESTLLINVYGIFLLAIFVIEIAAAIAAYVLQGEVKSMLIRTMTESLQLYSENEYVADAVDFMQTGFECCGVNNLTDWEGIFTNNLNEIDLPFSCCKDFITLDNCIAVNKEGCLNRMEILISQSSMLIATGATTVAFVQILGVNCAFMLAKTIRKTKSMREAKRWQLQQSLGILVNGGKDIYDTGYTQLHNSEKTGEPITYTPTSPSVN